MYEGTFKFCPECGASLGAQASGAPEARKVVTVLFCDLVGFTASSERADPEDVRARIDPYFARLKQTIESYGGTVDKYIGDAVMAVFGAPLAHEDDAERAVRSALRILEDIADLNEADRTLGLVVRIGVNTGDVLVRLGALDKSQGIITGDAVNTASRLQGAAPEGGIVVGERTYLATKDVFDYEALDPVSVKGKSEPLPIWRAKAARARFGTDLLRTHAAPLVGREDELELLKRTFGRTMRDNLVQLITLVGEPGVGKSRMVSELSSHVESLPDLVRWRQGRCLPYGDGITFWALGEIVKAEAGILETDPPDVAASKIDAVIPEAHPDAPWLRQRLRPLVGIEAPQAAREENFAAWRAFLELLAEGRPSVFVIEDLHWADDALVAFLEHLVDYAEGVPMLLVGTARPELFDKAPAFAQSARNSNRVHLSPLTQAETAKLVSNLLETAVLPAEVQSRILDRAEGNPLYAEELIRLLKDRGLLLRKGATVSLAPGADMPLPDTLQALIAARLDTLSPQQRGMLQDAAVVGKVFWAGTLAVIGDRDLAEVRNALHELSRKELVHSARTSSVAGESEFSFWHALVRDVAYSQIRRADRADKHRRAASWIESVAGDRVEDHAEILAHHYTEALALAGAAGLTELAVGVGASARRFLLLAGDRALGLDTARAMVNYTKALELAPSGDAGRPAILVRWGDAARQAGNQTEAAGALREAMAGFEEQGDDLRAAQAMVMLSNVLLNSGDPGGRELLEQAVARLEREPPGADLVAAYAQEANQSMRAGAYSDAIGWADRATSLAAEIGLEEPVQALAARGTSRCVLGDPGGLDEERRALATAVQLGLGRQAAVLYNNMAIDLYPTAGNEAARRMYEEGIRFAESRGIDEWALWMKTGLLGTILNAGEWDRILVEATPLADRLEAGGMMIGLIWVRAVAARVLLLRGESDEAAALIDWTLKATRTAGGANEKAVVFSLAARSYLAAGEPDRARDLLLELEQAQVREYNLPEVVQTALASGDLQLAERFTEGFQALYRLNEIALLNARALLAEARGEEEATGLFALAADQWESNGEVWDQAEALLGHARCLIAQGKLLTATSSLQEARSIFVRLGAKPAIAETDKLLERAIAASS
jgi:class 3 adenylate cyclase